LLEAVIGPQPADTSIHLRAEVSATLVPTGERHERYACQVRLDFERNPATRDPLPAVVRAVSRLNLYQMNELAWEEVEQSQVEQATRRMERLGTLLHHEGQTQLAQTAFNEAAQIARTGRISDDGRKKLKYGTRSLIGNDHLP
jgi:Ca-activated chloride channel family protein